MEGVPLMDIETLSVITALFVANYAALGLLYWRLGRYQTCISILCREHQQFHGGEEIKLP